MYKALFFSVLIFVSSSVFSASEKVVNDIQNIRLSLCHQTTTENQILKYDVLYHFLFSLSLVSREAYNVGLRLVESSANKETCTDGGKWIDQISENL